MKTYEPYIPEAFCEPEMQEDEDGRYIRKNELKCRLQTILIETEADDLRSVITRLYEELCL